MRSLFYSVAFLTFICLSPLALGQDIWTDADVDAYFTTTWDWRANDVNEFTTYWGEPLSPPWQIDSSVGIPVSGTNIPDPKTGWRLYEKHLNCIDYNQPIACTPSQAGASVLFPHFSLYNIYTGILRTFVFLNEQQVNDIRVLVSTDLVVGPTALESKHGLFLNIGDIATSTFRKAAKSNYGYDSVSPALLKRWVILDREISYDPSSIPNDLGFRYSIYGLSSSNLTLNGELVENVPGEQAVEEENPISDVSAYFDFAVASGKTIAKRLGSAQDTKSDLEKRGNKLKEDGHEWLAEKTLGLASTYASLGPYAAVAVAAGEIIWSFTKLNDQDHIQYTPKSLSINLVGDIEGTRRLDIFRIGVHGSTQSTTPDYSPSLDHNGSLGLFSLRQPPRIEVGDDYVKFLDSDFEDLINVNPASHMKLADLRVQPLIMLPVTMECLGSGGQWMYNNGAYNDPFPLPGVTTNTGGRKALISTKDAVDPRTTNLNLRWNPRDGCRAEASGVGYTDNSTSEQIYLKFYLKFEHEDPSHTDVNIELVRTYKADIQKTQCSLSSPETNDESYVERDHSVGYVGISKIRKYTHRPCNMYVGQVALFKYPQFRGINTALAFPYTRIGRIFTQSDHYRLGKTAIGNNEVSSIMLAPFTTVTLYDKKSWKGDSITITENVSHLGRYGWNNKAGSYRVHTYTGIVPAAIHSLF